MIVSIYNHKKYWLGSKVDREGYILVTSNSKINQFLGYQVVKHPIYAAAMMVPVALAFLFTVNQWAKNESGWKKKLITLPFLLLQLYPPFAALRLVVYLITRNRKWFDANKIYNQSVASIGKIFFVSYRFMITYISNTRGNHLISFGSFHYNQFS